MRKCFNWIRYW